MREDSDPERESRKPQDRRPGLSGVNRVGQELVLTPRNI